MTLPRIISTAPLPIIGLVSSFAEELLGVAAVRSILPACDRVYVSEGPIGDPGETRPTRWPSLKGTHAEVGSWDTDAAKRTHLLRRAQTYCNGKPFWAVFLDGDESFIWADRLPVWIRRAELEPWSDDLKVTGGFPLRIVELDGSVVWAAGRVFRGDLVEEFLNSSVEIRLKDSGASVGIGNSLCWRPGDEVDAYHRPPLQGEPHILHLSELRDPARQVKRQSVAELEDYRERAARLGLALPAWGGTDAA